MDDYWARQDTHYNVGAMGIVLGREVLSIALILQLALLPKPHRPPCAQAFATYHKLG